MRVRVKVALLVGLLAGVASVGEYSLHSAAHASTGATPLHTSKIRTTHSERKATKQVAIKDNDDYDSYVEVFNEIDEDPEHAQAKMITPSYDINN